MAQKLITALVVDDNLSWLRTLTRLTGEAGYTILTAKVFDEALLTAEKSKPDLIVTDIRLKDDDDSDIGGIRLLSILHEQGKLNASIVVTGYPDPETRKAAEQLGASYLEKGSFTREDFRYRLKKFGQICLHIGKRIQIFERQILFQNSSSS